LLRLHLSHLAIIVLTLNKFLWLKFEVFTGSPIHPPPLGALNLQVDRIPKEYILQRYTNSARQNVPFERADKKLKGKDGVTKSYRQKMLLTKKYEGCLSCMSKLGYARALALDELVCVLLRLKPDIGCDESGAASDGDANQIIVVIIWTCMPRNIYID
jgi:hypothetical protein